MPPKDSSDHALVTQLIDKLDTMSERGSKERAAQAERFSLDLAGLRAEFMATTGSARTENRWLMAAMLAIIAALAGVEVVFSPGGGIEARPSEDAPSVPPGDEGAETIEPSPAEPIAAPVEAGDVTDPDAADHDANAPLDDPAAVGHHVAVPPEE